MTILPSQLSGPSYARHTDHMVICGDDALAYRLTAELAIVYGERVTVLVPSLRRNQAARIAALAQRPELSVRVVERAEPDDVALRDAGVPHAAALALLLEQDQENIHTALRARRLNPQLRLVIRMYNRRLGRHLEDLLERTLAVRSPHLDASFVDASVTILSDADTAAPALVATALAGTRKIVQADGLLLCAADRPAAGDPAIYGNPLDQRPALCVLALLSAGGGTDAAGPTLLPDDDSVRGAAGQCGTVVLETITRSSAGPAVPRPRRHRIGFLPVGSFFSRRLRWAIAGLLALILLFGLLTSWAAGDTPLHGAYLSLLDLMGINDPAVEANTSRRVLQVLSGLSGMLLMPLIFAVVLESMGAFRVASTLRPPPRGLSDHVVLLGLGRIGTRVLDRLCALGIPTVCVERDPQARGVALARSRRVPILIADATETGVLESAKIDRSLALLALTSNDSTNLETTLQARAANPELRVVLRLFDDDFAHAVYRTLRDSYPRALTRSRSVSTLSAPPFAAAMMGRQILGAIPVERQVLLFAAIEVRGHPELVGRTVTEAFRPGAWRVLALDLADPAHRLADLSRTPDTAEWRRQPEFAWDVHPGYVLRPDDRVVLAATRRGLAHLLHRRGRDTRQPAPDLG